MYRSTSSSALNNNRLIKKIEKANEIAGDNRLLILGDFNLPNIDWTTNELKEGFDENEANMHEEFSDCFLHQHVKE